MTRFLLLWLFFWILIGVINIPVYNCFDITLSAYYSITATVALFFALFCDICMDFLRYCNGKS